MKARAADTGGALGLVDASLYRGFGSPLHVHRREDEAFYVLGGEIRFRRAEEQLIAGPGSWVWGPRDVPHTFKVESERARALILVTPGGFERMFEACRSANRRSHPYTNTTRRTQSKSQSSSTLGSLDRNCERKAMNSKRIIVTGPTSGIGKEIASRLAAEGAELILASRDLQRGEQTAEEISQQAAAAEPAVIPVDTSRPASIREFAREVERRYDHLDVLVNNAGVLSPERKTTADGVELTLATNVIGYYLMTQELLGILRTGAPARVVNVASTFAGNLDLDDLQFQSRPYDGMQAYAQSKACDRMLTWAFARRLADSGVTVNAIAPGLVTETRLYRDLPHGIRRQLEQQASRSTSEGADTAVWLAHAPELEGVSGRFYEQRNEQPCQFRDPDLTEMLWGRCQQITASEQRLRGTGRASSSQLRPRGSHGKLPVS